MSGEDVLALVAVVGNIIQGIVIAMLGKGGSKNGDGNKGFGGN